MHLLLSTMNLSRYSVPIKYVAYTWCEGRKCPGFKPQASPCVFIIQLHGTVLIFFIEQWMLNGDSESASKCTSRGQEL